MAAGHAPRYLSTPLTFISSVWDYVPTRFHFIGDVAAAHASDPNVRRGTRGPESTRSVITTRAENTE